MRTNRQVVGSALALAGAMAFSFGAHAQAAAPAPPPAAAPPPAPAAPAPQPGATAEGGAGMTLPPPPPAAAAQGDTDHDAVVGTVAIGYLGKRGLAVGEPVFGGGGPTGVANMVSPNVNAPIIGIRYWLDPMVGIDAGIGVGITSQSASVSPGGDVPAPSTTAFLVHAGLPLALANSGHFSFQLIPELNVGFGNYSRDQGAGISQSGSGFHFDVGARAGAEIHFGFIGLPRLSLLGTIGLGFAIDSTKLDAKAPGVTTTFKSSTTSFATSVQDNPWNIFTSNVAALYYF